MCWKKSCFNHQVKPRLSSWHPRPEGGLAAWEGSTPGSLLPGQRCPPGCRSSPRPRLPTASNHLPHRGRAACPGRATVSLLATSHPVEIHPQLNPNRNYDFLSPLRFGGWVSSPWEHPDPEPGRCSAAARPAGAQVPAQPPARGRLTRQLETHGPGRWERALGGESPKQPTLSLNLISV